MRKLALEKVRRRIRRGTARRDFVEPLIVAQTKGLISVDELEQQASILILAGSETTIVALTSATDLLLQNPAVLTELTKELHTSFRDESEIDVLSIHRLHYLQAVVQETLHLFPPITNGFPRQTVAAGTVVDGHFVPDGVSLIIGDRLLSELILRRQSSMLATGVRIATKPISRSRMSSSPNAGWVMFGLMGMQKMYSSLSLLDLVAA